MQKVALLAIIHYTGHVYPTKYLFFQGFAFLFFQMLFSLLKLVWAKTLQKKYIKLIVSEDRISIASGKWGEGISVVSPESEYQETGQLPLDNKTHNCLCLDKTVWI